MCLVPWIADVFFPTPYVKERLEDFILNHLNNYDIICFQECYGAFQENKDKLILCAQKAGFFFFHDCVPPHFYKLYNCDAGIIILSRFEIEKSEFVPYTYTVDMESLSEMGMLYASIKIGSKGHKLHLINTHLQSSLNYKEYDILMQSVECRTHQMLELKNFIETQTKEVVKDPYQIVVFCGDFNINSLKESDQFKSHVLSHNEQNLDFINMAEKEYDLIHDIFAGDYPGSIVDIVKEQFGEHQPTFMFVSLDKEKNKEYEHLNLNQCYDFIFEKLPIENFKSTNEKSITFIDRSGIEKSTIGGDIEDKSNEDEANEYNSLLSSAKSFKTTKLLGKKLRVKQGSISIEKFLATEDKPYPAISDHCGIQFSLEILNEND